MRLPYDILPLLLLHTILAAAASSSPQLQFTSTVVPTDSTLAALLLDEDTDRDTRITIDDNHVSGTDRGDKRFQLRDLQGMRFEVAGTYALSNLLQELKVAQDAGNDSTTVEGRIIFEPPTDRISRQIKQRYWDGLTRRMEGRELRKMLSDEKTTTTDGYAYIYVPASDALAHNFYTTLARQFPKETIRVVTLVTPVMPEHLRSLNGHHGILSLALRKEDGNTVQAVPYVVPGGRFNEMYGWDSYFITIGLLHDGRLDLAKSMVDNLTYEIFHYGKILNANRTYYLTRSQPPFLTSMITAVWQVLPKNPSNHEWLRKALEAAITEYTSVWMSKQHLTSIGLSRYFDSGHGPPPEVEPGHFEKVFERYAARHGMLPKVFEKAYRSGRIEDPNLDAYFVHDRAMRESGHDTSYRLEEQCANLATVDLNSLLYKIERDIGEMIHKVFGDTLVTSDGTVHVSSDWAVRASKRQALINRYLWNQNLGMFFDYDVVLNRQTGYVSATTLYPLWAGLATSDQAALVISNALPYLERAGGLAASSEESRGPITSDHPHRQWDYPYGWAPHQILAWQGLRNYNYDSIAVRLAYRWLYTITFNAVNYSGTVPEKFDVVKRSHLVFAEYGNVGTKFAYITREGFGWTNASYQIGLDLLEPFLRTKLDDLIPPEWIF